jgi:hypothetical protein
VYLRPTAARICRSASRRGGASDSRTLSVRTTHTLADAAPPASHTRVTSPLAGDLARPPGGEVVTFAWAFDSDTLYSPCEIDTELAADGEASAQITIHADHLFYDDLDSSTPDVAFDLIAASDANADGAVTQEELAAVDITAEARYQVGSHDIKDLWSFIAYQATTVGHINGEGHCESLQ